MPIVGNINILFLEIVAFCLDISVSLKLLNPLSQEIVSSVFLMPLELSISNLDIVAISCSLTSSHFFSHHSLHSILIFKFYSVSLSSTHVFYSVAFPPYSKLIMSCFMSLDLQSPKSYALAPSITLFPVIFLHLMLATLA